MKHIKYAISKYYVNFLDSEGSLVDSNGINVTGSEAVEVFPEI